MLIFLNEKKATEKVVDIYDIDNIGFEIHRNRFAVLLIYLVGYKLKCWNFSGLKFSLKKTEKNV